MYKKIVSLQRVLLCKIGKKEYKKKHSFINLIIHQNQKKNEKDFYSYACLVCHGGSTSAKSSL